MMTYGIHSKRERGKTAVRGQAATLLRWTTRGARHARPLARPPWHSLAIPGGAEASTPHSITTYK
jgi:hypothetical protein